MTCHTLVTIEAEDRTISVNESWRDLIDSLHTFWRMTICRSITNLSDGSLPKKSFIERLIPWHYRVISGRRLPTDIGSFSTRFSNCQSSSMTNRTLRCSTSGRSPNTFPFCRDKRREYSTLTFDSKDGNGARPLWSGSKLDPFTHSWTCGKSRTERHTKVHWMDLRDPFDSSSCGMDETWTSYGNF